MVVKGIENIEIVSDVQPEMPDMIVDQAFMDDGTTMYNRQQSLGIHAPSTVTIIGAGGVGSWAGLIFAMIGTRNIILVDDDKIDVTNLNRTPFKMKQVGMYKTLAMKELILERRSNINVMAYTRKYEDLPEPVKKSIINSEVVDCRDSIKPLKDIKSPIIGGYNGLNATIHIMPDLRHIFGEETSPYTIIPSYVTVPMMISGMIVNHMCVENRKNATEKVMNIDFKNFTKIFDKKPARKRSTKKSATVEPPVESE